MNTKEHVMVCGAEEAGEVAVAALAVQKALCKMMRFGKDDVNPERDLTATQVLVAELNDLQGAIELLQDAGVELPGLGDRGAIEAKKRKILHYMGYAEAHGTLS